jgi:hypothetical protein
VILNLIKCIFLFVFSQLQAAEKLATQMPKKSGDLRLRVIKCNKKRFYKLLTIPAITDLHRFGKSDESTKLCDVVYFNVFYFNATSNVVAANKEARSE